MRAFPLTVIVTAYTNVMVATFDEYRTFLNYMTREDLFIRDLPRARVAVAKDLDRQFPWLKKAIDMPSAVEPRGKAGGLPQWLKPLATKMGKDDLEVDRLANYKPMAVSLAGL